MRYVLDANVAVKWVLPEPDSDKALALLDDFRNHVHELIAPSTFAIECAHAFTRAERKGILLTGCLAAGANLRISARFGAISSLVALSRRTVVADAQGGLRLPIRGTGRARGVSDDYRGQETGEQS